MRTTITLDPDVAILVEKAMKTKDLTFKETINSAIRRGLAEERRTKAPFVQKTYSLGAKEGFHWDKSLAIAAALEDEELIRKLAMGK